MITFGTLANARDALGKFCAQPLPIGDSLKVARFYREALVELELFEGERRKLVKKHGQGSDMAGWVVPEETEEWVAFQDEYAKLVNAEASVEPPLLDPTALPANIKLSPVDALALGFLFGWDD